MGKDNCLPEMWVIEDTGEQSLGPCGYIVHTGLWLYPSGRTTAKNVACRANHECRCALCRLKSVGILRTPLFLVQIPNFIIFSAPWKQTI